jgi:putative spermidine/putrescine transport system ATP-binding protein
MQNAVELHNLTCSFGNVRAVNDVSLNIGSGEFFSLLGPSGSGKTTCLRLIGGFERPSSGRIVMFGKDASNLPPYARDVNTVFQDYALFPHMNVRDNVAYSQMVRGVDGAIRRREAEKFLEMVKLEGFGDRKPGQLSGGQRQRVALARALINKPRILLLDEPLGALDLKLREEMQIELKTLQRELKITFIYVTHDQGEALSMSDRVAVFNHGKIEQLDTPRVLYDQPRTVFVARFVGSSNVIDGWRIGHEKGRQYALRPERITVRSGTASGPNALNGTLLDVHYLGSQTRFEISVDGERLTAITSSEANLPVGQTVTLSWDAAALRLLEPEAAPQVSRAGFGVTP